MAKSIYSIMDTDGLRDYIKSNLEMFGLETDADGNEISSKVADAALEKVIANATDGRLRDTIRKSLDDWYGQQVYDRVYECIDDFVYDEVNSVLKELDKQGVDMPSVEATVDLQEWVRDYAMTTETVRFDCTLALNAFELSELPDEGDFSEGACDYGDNVFFEAVELGLTDDWGGPFTFYIGDWEAYDRYIAARVRNEYGYELREV